MNQVELEEQQAIKERAEHHAVLSSLQVVMSTKEGRHFVKYLLKSFDVTEPPPIGMQGELLHAHLGLLRAGNSVFKLVCQANPDIAGQLVAQVEKEKYEQILFEARRS
jgi:hypothetical protein